MIHTSKQLKDKVRNISMSDNDIAKTLIRNYIMERFLERISLSKYRTRFILKGGLLVSSIVGVDARATMDIDTTVKSLPLNENDIRRIIAEICEISIEDSVKFSLTSVTDIMTDFEYPGIRVILEAKLDRLRQNIKLDISTDDVITPTAIEYNYKLMFEDRTIPLSSYNIETLLAEKIQTIIARGIANTRMRDFYDVYEIGRISKENINKNIMDRAFYETCKKRETMFDREKIKSILAMIKSNVVMNQMWEMYKSKNYYVGDLRWDEVISSVTKIIEKYIIEGI